MNEVPKNKIVERVEILPNKSFPSSFAWTCFHGDVCISVASIDMCSDPHNIFNLRSPDLVPAYLKEFYEQFNNLLSDDEQIRLSQKPIYWFSRLSIHHHVRGQGWGTEFMKKITQTADQYETHIINGVNPYGDMTLEDTIRFYKKFGFFNYDIDHKEMLFRLAKSSSEN